MFLTFDLHPDRIVVDSNEDGFSKANLEAICSVGDSTKKHSAGYIGEKGIGFKSVFKIAKKVHIQSGPFSFAFSHTRDDEDGGLGMITPCWEDAEDLPSNVRTRMTLTLIDADRYEERACEFRDIPYTLLIFLSHLESLSITFNPPDDDHTIVEYSKRESEEHGMYTTILCETTSKGNSASTSEQKYYTFKSDLQNLPFDGARIDKEGKNIDQATVILAFPVDESDEPVLEQQYTYAYLPLRRVGFNFLIQSDFITQANREDVVHSKRNQAVLKGVATAFTDAMVVFCDRRLLRYQWMRYLPEDSVTDEYWGNLWGMIRERLGQTALLEPWSGKGLYVPSSLQRLPGSLLDEDGTPLLPDFKHREIYLSPMYSEADFQSLKRLGTTLLQQSKFVDRLEADLSQLRNSKWKCMEQDDDWRSSICKYLTKILNSKSRSLPTRLKSLALIPLDNGEWVSSLTFSDDPIYFPETSGTTIPPDLGLTLVHPDATENAAWISLLSALQVTDIDEDLVINLIIRRYQAPKFDEFDVENAVAHVEYLYWFLSEDDLGLASHVRLANQYGSLLKKTRYLYFPNEEDEYSPAQLFKPGAQYPGHPVNYLHEDYLNAIDPGIVHNGRSWAEWLEEVVKVRLIPELIAHDHDGLSKEFRYIIDHQSNRLLELLRRGWADYCPYVVDAAKKELLDSAVLLENGARKPLSSTFLPMPKLREIAAELSIGDTYPFVAMSEPIKGEQRTVWNFVEDLQVGLDENLVFYVHALTTFKDAHRKIRSDSLRDQLAKIYENIQKRCGQDPETIR